MNLLIGHNLNSTKIPNYRASIGPLWPLWPKLPSVIPALPMGPAGVSALPSRVQLPAVAPEEAAAEC